MWMELNKQYLVKQRVRHYCSENFINSLKITFLLIPWWSSGFFKRLLKKLISSVRLFATPWAVAYQAPLSMGFSRQEYRVGCHFLLQGIFRTQGSNPGFPNCRQMLYHLSLSTLVDNDSSFPLGAWV